MKTFYINFKTEQDAAAHEAWCNAIDMIGGPVVAAELSGIRQPTISIITHGKKIKSKQEPSMTEHYRQQVFPTIEQALKISLLTDCKITAEELVPRHCFRYIYTYVKERTR